MLELTSSKGRNRFAILKHMDRLVDNKDWTWVLDRPCADCGFEAGAMALEQVRPLLTAAVASLLGALAAPNASTRPFPTTWSPLEYACHVRRYKVGELREKVERAGFEVRLETSFVSLLLPAMLASRRSRRTGQQADDAMSELRLPRPLDWALACVMGFERALIRMGLRLPVGGSLLLVATKRPGLH